MIYHKALARFYSQNYLDLPNPYKRYQIQNVFRREKPGNGRYKSFDQCDVDIIGKFEKNKPTQNYAILLVQPLFRNGIKKIRLCY